MYLLSSSSLSSEENDSQLQHTAGKDQYCLIMENMFHKNLRIHRQYDLKGSKRREFIKEKKKERYYERYTSQNNNNNSEDQPRSSYDKDKEQRNAKVNVGFDQDFISEQESISIDQSDRNDFLERLKSDINFLADNKIMSYSLLVGIHDCKRFAIEDALTSSPSTEFHSSHPSTKQVSPFPPNFGFNPLLVQNNRNNQAIYNNNNNNPHGFIASDDKGYESPEYNLDLMPGDRIGDANVCRASTIDSQSDKGTIVNEGDSGSLSNNIESLSKAVTNLEVDNNNHQTKVEITVDGISQSKSVDRCDDEINNNNKTNEPQRKISTDISNHFVFNTNNYAIKSSNNNFIYFMGLIDCLSEYDTEKKVAHVVKHAKHGSEISTVKPQKYKDRFLDFVEKQVVPLSVQST